MPIRFVTLSEPYAAAIRSHGYDARVMKIQDYVPDPSKKTYYVSPANSLCFMDGGIDYALSRIVFPGIETEVKRVLRSLNITNCIDRPYLPIGSSIIVDRSDITALVVAPTMLLPQNVSGTRNAYYATMAVLYNVLVNRGESLTDVDIVLTSMCCGYGKMTEEESICQILDAIRDYKDYQPRIVNRQCIVHEPNLLVQPKFYQNTEFFSIRPEEIQLAS